jgi:hypothetical protein
MSDREQFTPRPPSNREAMPFKLLDSAIVQRVVQGAKAMLGGRPINAGKQLVPGMRPRIEPSFFPPGEAMMPAAPDAAGRAFDYPTNYNITYTPRSFESVSFETLRGLAEFWDMLRLAIETRKDQMAKLEFSVMCRKLPGQELRPRPDDRCIEIERFLRQPDRNLSWADWVRELVEEQLVIDAPAIYCKRTVGGKPWALQIIAGDTITPKINYWGRRPAAPDVAFQQVIKGLPAVDYTADEMIYAPRNPRANKVYGFSPVQQILMTINIGLRRQVGQLNYFTEGNVPDALAQVPPDWSPDVIMQFQQIWDSMMADFTQRRKMKFIPGGVNFIPTRLDNSLMDQFDEWLARVVCYCFSLPPLPFVKVQNRSTAETAYETSISEGLEPLMMWLKNIIDDIIARWFGYDDLEMVWDDVRKVDPAEKEERDLAKMKAGVISMDDMRLDEGKDPLGVPPIVFGIGPMGFMAVSDLVKCIKMGYTINGPPQPMAMPGMAGMAGPPGSAPPGIAPSVMGQDPNNPLAGLPPALLAAFGLPGGGADPKVAPAVRVNQQDLDDAYQDGHDDAMLLAGADRSNVVPIHKHPAIVSALRDGERAAHHHARHLGGR